MVVFEVYIPLHGVHSLISACVVLYQWKYLHALCILHAIYILPFMF